MMVSFFPTGYSEGSEAVNFIRVFEKYLQELRPSLQRNEIEERRAFTVNLKVLLENETVKKEIPDLSELVVTAPDRIIKCLGLAMHQVRLCVLVLYRQYIV